MPVLMGEIQNQSMKPSKVHKKNKCVTLDEQRARGNNRNIGCYRPETLKDYSDSANINYLEGEIVIYLK